MAILNHCINCSHYSTEFMPEENRSENYCDYFEHSCFNPCSNCPQFKLYFNITHVPAFRRPNFDIKRSLIHQLATSNPDITIQQMADTVSRLTSKEPCNLDCSNCNEFYLSIYCFPEA